MHSYHCRRQIHLDFHTSPDIPDVGCQWDAKLFAQRMVEAHVDSVTVFAKCHHGHLYYQTDHPAKHPTLPAGLDLLGEQIEALHSHGIAAPIYMSVQIDEYAAMTHPEWLAIDEHGTPTRAKPLEAGWHTLDMSSPYQDYLADQLETVLKTFSPVDGIFFDMCWDQPSCSRGAISGLLKAGLDPSLSEDRLKYARQVTHNYMHRFNQMISQHHKSPHPGSWYNSRPMVMIDYEKQFVKHLEVESLPTGGWGYMFFPLNIRQVRRHQLPTVGMTARFHKGWGDFGGRKNEAALMYECCQMLAHGAACSIGDQMHPRGILDGPAYDSIGRVYRYIEQCESWCINAKVVTEIAVIRPAREQNKPQPGSSEDGIIRGLGPLQHQFDIMTAHAVEDWDAYSLVIVADGVQLNDTLTKQLLTRLRAGKPTLILGGKELAESPPELLTELGVTCQGMSPFSHTYLHHENETGANDHVMYERGCRLQADKNAKVLTGIVEPYFERTWQHYCSHFHTPSDTVSPYAAAIAKGAAITTAFGIFKAYAQHGSVAYRNMLASCIAQLLPTPLLQVKGPSFLETTIMQQDNQWVIHLLAYCPQQRAVGLSLLEEGIDVVNLALSMWSQISPREIYLEPQHTPLSFTHDGQQIHVTIPHFNGHQMVVITMR